MKPFSAILLIAVMVLAMAAVPGNAGYKDQWVKFRATMVDKPDSKIICPLFTPWPWKCACNVDSDGDGICDTNDKCPGTPAGAKVDKSGCPADADGDGVSDGIDQCPNTPAGAKVDAKGCPMDSDGDGVYDGIDKCPNTPAGTKVDETGCPVEVKKFIDTGLISTTEILFDFNKATLKPESKAPLDAIGNILMQVPDLKIEVGGHTDGVGSDVYNKKLSDARAKTVRDYLVKNFPQINGDNISSAGYGESKPVATNDTKEGQAKNRRVEFKILK
jgi:OOP family OmpA-OmpF porin